MTTKPLGTGLGLTIVKRIIENHGGTIALHDSLEKGTTFVISLPIGRKEE
ncbi:signal transduction histidine kinase [Anoxybacillus flavithermus TNO-09.006]|nr:signal transduction histidine kinase [Anoxybacillus flavithermus TNO-09.006]